MIQNWRIPAVVALVCAGASLSLISQAAPVRDGKVPVVFKGGHETLESDHGRPVILIAAALGVPPEVFREAFSAVRPAPPGRGPTEEEARANKDALLGALAKYGVTNDRLDIVSDYYRYRRDRGELWPTSDARALAIVQDGKVIGYEVTDSGSGYSSVPSVSIPSIPNASAIATLSFSKEFENNGCISSLSFPVAPEDEKH